MTTAQMGKGRERLPPHSTEAEQGVLGCCLISPEQCIAEAAAKLPRPEAFYDLRHRTIFEALSKMADDRTPIDLITVQNHLKTAGQLDQVGGVAYLSSLMDTVPSAANIGMYVTIVKEKFDLRRTLYALIEGQIAIYESTEEPDVVIDQVEAQVLSATEQRATDGQQPIKDLIFKAIDKIENAHTTQGAATMGILTGFPDLDRMTTGLHGGEMIVIAARPSMGKTSLAMNIAEHAAISQKLPVGVFSLEMTNEALVMRMLCSRARVNIRKMKDGILHERDFPKLTTAGGQIANAPLYIDDSSGLSIMQLRAKARRMHQQYGIKLFVIDYLQLLNSTNRRAENRQQEIADISSGCKALAKELDVPVIVLSQLNREVEKDKGRKPRMSDLRESGAIEQDADLIGLLYKPNDEEPDQDEKPVPVNLYIAKQRNGPTGDVYLTFFKEFTRFEQGCKPETKEAPHSTPRRQYQSQFRED